MYKHQFSKIICESKLDSNNYHPQQVILVGLFAKFTSTDAINTRVNEKGIRDNEKSGLKQVMMANGKWLTINLYIKQQMKLAQHLLFERRKFWTSNCCKQKQYGIISKSTQLMATEQFMFL